MCCAEVHMTLWWACSVDDVASLSRVLPGRSIPPTQALQKKKNHGKTPK